MRQPKSTIPPGEPVHGDDVVKLERREFLAAGGGLALTAALGASGCQPPPETSLPFSEQPEGLRTQGRPRVYATVLRRCPVLVRTREGRPILVTPNTASRGARGFSVREQAALLDLYDPDRAQGPLYVGRGKGAPVPVEWTAVGAQLARRLAAKTGNAVLLVDPQSGPATLSLLGELSRQLGLRVVSYSPLARDAVLTVQNAVFGPTARLRPRLDRARLVVGLGSRFLDEPETGLEGLFALRRRPDSQGGMSRFIQLEGRLSLTGANADRRIRVRDSQLANIAAALANEIVVQRRMGPLASDPVVNAALEPFHLDKVAAMAQVPPALIRSLADELQAAAGHCVVLGDGPGSTTAAGSTLEAAVVLVNHALGNYNNSCFEAADAVGEPPVGPSGLQTLVDEMRGGKVDLLVIAGPNPLHDAAGIADFAKAMDSVGFVVSLNDRLDETARHADYLAPAGHALESWGDAALGLGVVAVQQPVLTPLYDTPGFLDVLVSVGAAAGAGGPVAAAFAASQPDAKGLRPAGSIDSPAYHYVKQHWEQTVLTQGGRWDDVLRAGEFQGPVPPALAWPPGASAVLASLVGTPIPSRPELEVELYPHHALGDGRAGNNGWLHELPDPITRLTWGGAVSIAPRRFDAMGLQNGDVVEVAVGSRKLALPAYRHAGMHEDQVSVPLGLGRTDCGLIGKGAGVNAFPLAASQGGRVLLAGLECSLRKLDAHDPLATTQPTEVLDRKPRPLVPTTTLAAFLVNPRAGTEQQPGGPSAFPGHDYKEQRWGMAIDLSLCNGCGKCVLGCQAENNIPVVGKKTIIAGRQMSWMRIDRYYDAPEKPGGWSDDVWDGPLAVVEEPRTLFEPMLCQHCDNAPCETVCPFNATMHSEDGMNQQVYNRCVGTRYCANNCPFKVRRYNWFEYSKVRDNRLFALIYPEMVQHGVRNARGRMQMKNNPEVTVRSRGVMEKCTFCVQRVREARAHATRQGQPGKIPDGQVVTACGEACPTGAIVFGDLNDPKSKVRSLVDSPRAMRLLEFLGVKPSVSYLTRVRNDNT